MFYMYFTVPLLKCQCQMFFWLSYWHPYVGKYMHNKFNRTYILKVLEMRAVVMREKKRIFMKKPSYNSSIKNIHKKIFSRWWWCRHGNWKIILQNEQQWDLWKFWHHFWNMFFKKKNLIRPKFFFPFFACCRNQMD